MLDFFFFQLGDKMNGGLVFVLCQMPIHAIVAGIDLAAFEPFPARRIAGVQDCIPVLIPVEHIGVFLETVREIFQAEPVKHTRICHVGLGNKFCAWMKIFLFPPMYRNFGFGSFNNFLISHNYLLSLMGLEFRKIQLLHKIYKIQPVTTRDECNSLNIFNFI